MPSVWVASVTIERDRADAGIHSAPGASVSPPTVTVDFIQ